MTAMSPWRSMRNGCLCDDSVVMVSREFGFGVGPWGGPLACLLARQASGLPRSS